MLRSCTSRSKRNPITLLGVQTQKHRVAQMSIATKSTPGLLSEAGPVTPSSPPRGRTKVAAVKDSGSILEHSNKVLSRPKSPARNRFRPKENNVLAHDESVQARPKSSARSERLNKSNFTIAQDTKHREPVKFGKKMHGASTSRDRGGSGASHVTRGSGGGGSSRRGSSASAASSSFRVDL